MSTSTSPYAPVASDEVDTEKLLSQTTSPVGWSEDNKVETAKRFSRWWPWVLHIVLLFISLTVLLDAHLVKDKQCTKRLNAYCELRPRVTPFEVTSALTRND